MTTDELVFLDVDDVIELHTSQLEVFGGGSGLRDRDLLESAVAQPQASFGDQYAHDGLFSMAAAYLFHIVSNHPSDHQPTHSRALRWFRHGPRDATALPGATRLRTSGTRLLRCGTKVTPAKTVNERVLWYSPTSPPMSNTSSSMGA